MIYMIVGRHSGKQHLLAKIKEYLEKPYIELDEYEKEILKMFGLVHKDVSEDLTKLTVDVEAFRLANIELTDYQKEAISRLKTVCHNNIEELMIPLMRETTASIEQLSKALITEINKPQKDYNQRHKPWKKERFYY